MAQESLTNEVLTLDLAKEVFIYSYYISQGSPSLQDNVFYYVHCARPSWRVDDELKISIIEGVVNSVGKLIHNASLDPDSLDFDSTPAYHRPVDGQILAQGGGIRGFLQQEIDMMQLDLNSSVIDSSKAEIIPTLTYRITEKDLRFIHGRNRRLIQGGNVIDLFLADTHLSQLCYHAFLGNTVRNIAVYDELFRDVGEHIRTLPRLSIGMTTIIEKFNQHHPETPVILPKNNVHPSLV